jgi:hypothetical protein
MLHVSQHCCSKRQFCLQVQATQPCPAVSAALDTLLQRSQAVISSSAVHTLQVARATAARLAVVHLVSTRSPLPLLSGGSNAARAKEQIILEVFSDAFNFGRSAVMIANASSTGEAPSGMEGAGRAETALEIEAPIGFAAAMASELALCGPGMHLLQDTLEQGLLCIIEAQSLQDPGLKTLTQQLRAVALQLTGVLWRPAHVGAIAECIVDCLEMKNWQSRGAAVKLLQTLWYRCACRSWQSCQIRQKIG